MVHGDDQGLILPPRLAPYRLWLCRFQEGRREVAGLLEAAKKCARRLLTADIRVKVDEREGMSLGLQIQRLGDARRAAAHGNRAEGRGQGQRGAGAARSARQGREEFCFTGRHRGIGRATTGRDSKALFDRALAFRNTHTFKPKKLLEDLRTVVEQGFARSCIQKRRRSAKSKSRKRPRPRCGASLSSNLGKRDLASSRKTVQRTGYLREGILDPSSWPASQINQSLSVICGKCSCRTRG